MGLDSFQESKQVIKEVLSESPGRHSCCQSDRLRHCRHATDGARSFELGRSKRLFCRFGYLKLIEVFVVGEFLLIAIPPFLPQFYRFLVVLVGHFFFRIIVKGKSGKPAQEIETAPADGRVFIGQGIYQCFKRILFSNRPVVPGLSRYGNSWLLPSGSRWDRAV